MDWLTTTWVIFASMSVALSGVYFLRWLRRRELLMALFVLLGLAIAVQAGVEIWMFRASTVDEYGRALRWLHVPIFAGFCIYVGIIRLRFGAGRIWLGIVACALRFVSLVINFVHDPNVNYAELTAIASVTVLGEAATIGVGTPYPWMITAQLAFIFLLLYLLDAARNAWRRENSRRAMTMGIAMGIFVIAGMIQGISIFWDLVDAPVLAAPFFIGVAIILGADAGIQMTRADELDRELRENKARLDQLSQAAAMSEVSGSLAHEINQPLGVIMSNAEAASMLLESEQVDRDELRAIVSDIISADQRAADVVRRLRGVLQRGDPERRDCQLADVIGEACNHVEKELASQGVELIRREIGPLPVVSADGILVVQVLMNLIVNARDAVLGNPAGKRRVTLGAFADERNVTITIEDNGVGMTVEPEEAFKAFVTTKQGGMGLGLPIVKTVIEAHDGTIETESTPGHGTVFRVTIPRKSGSE
jgi:signal transduction histidine kinase